MMSEITAEDGHLFEAWVEPAHGERRGGLVILQEIFGVTDQLKAVAHRYATLGYEVAVPALYDRQERGIVIDFSDMASARKFMSGLDRDEALMDTMATVSFLANHGGKVGVLGFCWGGGMAVRAAQEVGPACAVSFYGTRLDTCLDRGLMAPVQGHFGTRDDHIPPELLAQVEAAFGPMIEVFTYEAGHAFANEAREAIYVADAAELAHQRTADFLARNVG